MSTQPETMTDLEASAVPADSGNPTISASAESQTVSEAISAVRGHSGPQPAGAGAGASVGAEASAPGDPQPPAEPSAPVAPLALRPRVEWERHVVTAGRWLIRPRVRLALLGVLLLLIGAVWITSSVWTLPIVIAGVVLVIAAWAGPRLEGHFHIEWGTTGTELHFRAKVHSAEPHRPELASGHPATPARQQGELALVPKAVPSDPDVIEGHGRTVEINVDELKALIAVAEAQDALRVSRSENVTPTRTAHSPRRAS
jgi:hypothetical protein